MNNKGMIGKCLMLVGIVLVAAGCIMFALDKDKYFSSEDKSGNSDNNKPSDGGGNSNTSVSVYSGVFEKDGALLKLFQNYDIFFISYSSDFTSIYSNGKIVDDVLKPVDGNYSIKYDNERVIITSTDDEEMSGTYSKVGDYKKEEFFSDVYGDASYLDGTYNVQFGDGNSTINMYRVNESSVYVEMLFPSLRYSSDFSIKEDGTLENVSELLGARVVITMKDSSITISVDTDDPESVYLSMNGDYDKVKVLSIDDIINEISK